MRTKVRDPSTGEYVRLNVPPRVLWGWPQKPHGGAPPWWSDLRWFHEPNRLPPEEQMRRLAALISDTYRERLGQVRIYTDRLRNIFLERGRAR